MNAPTSKSLTVTNMNLCKEFHIQLKRHVQDREEEPNQDREEEPKYETIRATNAEYKQTEVPSNVYV